MKITSIAFMLSLLVPVISVAQTPPNTAILSWDGIDVVEQNGQSNVGYRVYEQKQPCASVTLSGWQWVSGDLPAGVLTWTSTGLQDNRTYCWYVTAFTPLAESDPSNTVDKYLPFPGVTPAPFLQPVQ